MHSALTPALSRGERALFGAGGRGTVQVPVAGRACSYRCSPQPQAAPALFPSPAGRRWPAGSDEGSVHSALTPALSRGERGLFGAGGRGTPCRCRSQAEPAPTGANRNPRRRRRFSLLPPGEGGPQGRMREACTAPSPQPSPEGRGGCLVPGGVAPCRCRSQAEPAPTGVHRNPKRRRRFPFSRREKVARKGRMRGCRSVRGLTAAWDGHHGRTPGAGRRGRRGGACSACCRLRHRDAGGACGRFR